jgi:hypothetical protein
MAPSTDFDKSPISVNLSKESNERERHLSEDHESDVKSKSSAEKKTGVLPDLWQQATAKNIVGVKDSKSTFAQAAVAK